MVKSVNFGAEMLQLEFLDWESDLCASIKWIFVLYEQ